MSNRISGLIKAIFFIFVIIVVMMFFNGMTRHTITGENLKSTFLSDIYSKGAEKGVITEEYNYSNSKTLFFESEKGQQAAATYIKSIYSNKWSKAYLIYLEKEQEIQNGGMDIVIDDHFSQYKMNYQQQENGKLFVEVVGESRPLLAIRLFSIGVIVTAAAIGRMVGIHMERKKMDILGKK